MKQLIFPWGPSSDQPHCLINKADILLRNYFLVEISFILVGGCQPTNSKQSVK